MHAFWVLTSLYLLSFYWKCFYYSCFRIFCLNGLNMFCRLQKYWCKLYIIWNHSIMNALKLVHQWRSVLIIILFHLQMMSNCLFSISLTELSTVLQEIVLVTVSTIRYSNAYHSILIFISFIKNLTNFIMFEDRNAHAQLYNTWVH